MSLFAISFYFYGAKVNVKMTEQAMAAWMFFCAFKSGKITEKIIVIFFLHF